MTALLPPADLAREHTASAESPYADGVIAVITADRAHVGAWLHRLASPQHPPIPHTPERVEAEASRIRDLGLTDGNRWLVPWSDLGDDAREPYRRVARWALDLAGNEVLRDRRAIALRFSEPPRPSPGADAVGGWESAEEAAGSFTPIREPHWSAEKWCDAMTDACRERDAQTARVLSAALSEPTPEAREACCRDLLARLTGGAR